MSTDFEIESINEKYQRLASKAYNDTKHISFDELFNEVLPRLNKEKEREINLLKCKRNEQKKTVD